VALLQYCPHRLVAGGGASSSNGSMDDCPDFKGKAKVPQTRGGQLIVIDPSHGNRHLLADTHQLHSTSADVFLLAAMVHTKTGSLGGSSQYGSSAWTVRQAVAPFTPELAAARAVYGGGHHSLRWRDRLASTPRCCSVRPHWHLHAKSTAHWPVGGTDDAQY
jgi:hypothetical protein